MATSLQTVYDAFLARITEDDWMTNGSFEAIMADWRQLLNMSIFRFKHPKIALTINEESEEFIETLTNDEIQILGIFMKHEWLKRCVADWQNVRQLYSTKDFSQANFLSKITNLEEQVRLECEHMYGTYDRKNAKNFAHLSGK